MTVAGNVTTLGSRIHVTFITTVNEMMVDREKVSALEDVKEECMAIRAVVEEEAVTEAEGQRSRTWWNPWAGGGDVAV